MKSEIHPQSLQSRTLFFAIISLLVITLAICLLIPLQVRAAEYSEPTVPVVTDLSTLASESTQRHVPILLMFSAEDCDYCMRLEEDVIRPMLISGDFDRRAIMRKVMLDSAGELKDFNGAKLDIDNYATQHKVRVTPTLMFVDANGRELAPKVIGYQTGELYGAYLENAIEASRDTILKQQAN